MFICSGSSLAVKFAFFLNSRLFFKRFYWFCMFLNKHFINTGPCISKTVLEYKTFGILFSCEDEYITRFSYLH